MHSMIESKPCLPDWLKIRLNQVAPIVLGKQATYPLEFWHKIVGLPNNGYLLEDVPTSIVSSLEIYELFNYSTYNLSKKLSTCHLKSSIQAKKFVDWHNKVYCCQPYNGELCQCFVRAYLAHFEHKIHVNWAQTAYEHYKRLQQQSIKKDPYLTHIPIPALDEQLLALKFLFVDITQNLQSLIKPNLSCNYLDHSTKKEFNNSIYSNFVEKESNKKVVQSPKNSNPLSNNFKILQESENNVVQKLLGAKSTHQLESQIDSISKTENFINSNVLFNDTHKNVCLTRYKYKPTIISQQLHSCVRNSSNKSEFMNIQSPLINDHIGSTSLFTLDYLETPENNLSSALEKLKECNPSKEVPSLVDELLEISTSSGSQEVSSRISIKDDKFSPRMSIDEKYMDTNCSLENHLLFSKRNVGMEFDLIPHCSNVAPHTAYEKSSVTLQNSKTNEEENIFCIPKLNDYEQNQNKDFESMIPPENNKDNDSTNKIFNLKKPNSSFNIIPLSSKEKLIKSRQRIGINILIHKSREHNNLPPIKKYINERQVRHNDIEQDVAYSPIIDASNNGQKPVESFQMCDLDLSQSASTSSPPCERAPLSIDTQEQEYSDNMEKGKIAKELCDLTISNTVNNSFENNIMPTTCSKTMCSNCNYSLINSEAVVSNIDGRSKENTERLSKWLKEPCLSHQTNMPSIKDICEEQKEKFNSKISNIFHEHTESKNYEKNSHSKINFPLHSFRSNIRNMIGTLHDNNVNKNTTINIPKFKTTKELPKTCCNLEDKIRNKMLPLEVPPLHLEKVVCQKNESFREVEEYHALNEMKGQLDSSRIEISANTCVACSTQENDSYFPYCVQLSNIQSLIPFTSEQITNRSHKQHVCATLVHHIESCDMNMELKSYESSIYPISNDETKVSTIINTKSVKNIDIQHKPNICHVNNNNSLKCEDMKNIFGDSNGSLQKFKECNRNIKQCGTTLCVRPPNKFEMLYAIKPCAPAMKCAQAEYILEEKKKSLTIEKAMVEDLIQKGNSQHILNQQLTSILKSKLEEYDKLCMEIQNLALKISKYEDNHLQLSLYRDKKQDKEDMIEALQNEIEELHKVHRNMQAQLDMNNYMLVESLITLDNLTLDTEKAEKELEQIIKEKSLDKNLNSIEEKSNLMCESKMVDTMYSKESFELSKAMKTMIQIQQNRFKSTIDERSLNKNDTNYDLKLQDILNKKCNKKNDIFMDSKTNARLSRKLNDTMMPTMATLSHSSNFEIENKFAKLATLLVKNCMKKKQNIDGNLNTTTCKDNSTLQWSNTNLENKTKIISKGFKKENHKKYDGINISNHFFKKPNDDVDLKTTDSIINENFTCSAPFEERSNSSRCSSSMTSYSGHYYDVLHCKQRLKHEKCDIHGIDLRMVCAYSTNKLLATQNKIKKNIIERYGAHDIYNKKKPMRIKTKLKAKPLYEQCAQTTKKISKEEQVFESYKTLGFVRKKHNHLNEFDSSLFISNRQRNTLIKSTSMKVKDQELHKMIDDIMLLNHDNGSTKNTKKI